MGQRRLFLSFLAIAALAFSSCAQEGESLAGDQIIESKCPLGGCAQSSADRNQISITSAGKTTIFQTAKANDRVEIGGDCYTSTYPQNRIEVTIFRGPTQISMGAGTILAPRADSTTLACVHGRFNIAIMGSRMPTGAVYRAHVRLIGIDTNGIEYDNSGTGAFDINISR